MEEEEEERRRLGQKAERFSVILLLYFNSNVLEVVIQKIYSFWMFIILAYSISCAANIFNDIYILDEI
jgi:hypothetical protein